MRTLFAIQETHGSAADLEARFPQFCGSRLRASSRAELPAVGGVLALIRNAWLTADTLRSVQILVAGRVIRACCSNESSTVVVWSLNIFGMTGEDMANIRVELEDDLTLVAAAPLSLSALVTADCGAICLPKEMLATLATEWAPVFASQVTDRHVVAEFCFGGFDKSI